MSNPEDQPQNIVSNGGNPIIFWISVIGLILFILAIIFLVIYLIYSLTKSGVKNIESGNVLLGGAELFGAGYLVKKL